MIACETQDVSHDTPPTEVKGNHDTDSSQLSPCLHATDKILIGSRSFPLFVPSGQYQHGHRAKQDYRSDRVGILKHWNSLTSVVVPIQLPIAEQVGNSSFHFVGVSSSADEAPAADAHDLQPRAAGAPILNINSIPERA